MKLHLEILDEAVKESHPTFNETEKKEAKVEIKNLLNQDDTKSINQFVECLDLPSLIKYNSLLCSSDNQAYFLSFTTDANLDNYHDLLNLIRHRMEQLSDNKVDELCEDSELPVINIDLKILEQEREKINKDNKNVFFGAYPDCSASREVKFFNTERGFGFVKIPELKENNKSETERRELFFHITDYYYYSSLEQDEEINRIKEKLSDKSKKEKVVSLRSEIQSKGAKSNLWCFEDELDKIKEEALEEKVKTQLNSDEIREKVLKNVFEQTKLSDIGTGGYSIKKGMFNLEFYVTVNIDNKDHVIYLKAFLRRFGDKVIEISKEPILIPGAIKESCCESDYGKSLRLANLDSLKKVKKMYGGSNVIKFDKNVLLNGLVRSRENSSSIEITNSKN